MGVGSLDKSAVDVDVAERSGTVDFLGIPIHAVSLDQAVDLLDAAIQEHKPLHVGVVNAAKVVNMARDPVLREAVLSSDVIFADGMSVVWGGRILGERLPERVTGIDLMMKLLERGTTRGYRVFCLGATEAVSKRVAEIIGKDFHGVNFVGRHHGYYRPEEEERVVSMISAAKPDILFVAMTSPKKENFLARWGEKLNATVTHGVGGSFDVLSGEVQRAPESWQKLGLEWLYRLKQEPGRFWRRYLVTNSLFCYMVIKAVLRSPASTRR